MSDVKQVKVDNWGIYFLQRLKHFFNRTDYCDLTLQFQDNAQLKVHRLVLSACTEYFELLERTCEMYEDRLVMPDDLQADVVVPIVNFMYTGHLEFRMDLLERLYLTSQILNMPVLSKLLESHRNIMNKTPSHNNYASVKKYSKTNDSFRNVKSSTPNKRSYSKAFGNNIVLHKDKKVYQVNRQDNISIPKSMPFSPTTTKESIPSRKILGEPRPTRYELPEELDADNIFDNSFCNISYTSQPLMVHPETAKSYSAKRSKLFSEASSSKKIITGPSTVDIVECKRITKDDHIFDDSIPAHNSMDDSDIFHTSFSEPPKDSNHLFDQILEPSDSGPKISIETKDNKQAANIDHAKIISEVLKKYPHLVKSNKNIKLKILDTPTKPKKQRKPSPKVEDMQNLKLKAEPDPDPDYTYETDVLDSKQAAKLIAMGAENIKGPWICLICGTPGKALHFTSYYKFRRHLVEVHNEKPLSNICEYCGLKSLKRNYLLHHLYSQHGIEPPPSYNFPKCNKCPYIALTEGLLVKHKLTHKDQVRFTCNVCVASFSTTYQLLVHIQNTGHKYSADRKTNLQCIYCTRGFLREGNLYAHLKTNHRKEAKSDGIIDDSDEEEEVEVPVESSPVKQTPRVSNEINRVHAIKFEPLSSLNQLQSSNYDNEDDVQYQIDHKGDIIVSKKQVPKKQKILNSGFETPSHEQKPKPRQPKPEHSDFLEEINIPSPTANEDEIVVIDNNEYIVRDHQLIPRKQKINREEYLIPDIIDSGSLQNVQPSTSMDYSNIHNNSINDTNIHQTMVLKKTSDLNQPIQIVVSSEEEYKALIAANHPIIFNNGDTNKTLTVLAAPHNATEQTSTIDLNNTQSNDMMIIQDDYPLNATESVSGENSNIVVVYSHPVEDQKQQYQLLTSGDIGAQFVQSSAIITQNYETVTTSTSVMSAHVISQEVDQTWTNNVQSLENQQMQQIVPAAQLQQITETTHIDAITAHNDQVSSNLEELPEVSLVPVQQQNPQPQDDPVEETPIQSDLLNIEHTNQDLEQQVVEVPVEDISMTPMEIDMSSESMINQETVTVDEPTHTMNSETISEVLVSNEDLEHMQIPAESASTMDETGLITVSQHEVHNIEAVSNIENTIEASKYVPSDNVLPSDEKVSPNHEIPCKNETSNIQVSSNNEVPSKDETPINNTANNEIPPNEEAPSSNETSNNDTPSDIQPSIEEPQSNNDLPEPTLPESQAYDDIILPENDNSQPTYTKVVEKIQNLTSEWSEDEYDTPEDNETVENIANEISQNVDQGTSVVSCDLLPQTHEIIDPGMPEIEESIENIQQEVQKQMPATLIIPESELATECHTNLCLEASLADTPEPQPTVLNENVVPEIDPQQKISSLLNDWEDNDSQEENASQDENEVTTKDDESIHEEVPPSVIPETEIIKNDNIKNLVSDWDDDDEEKELAQ